jgi:tRNA dimethylallyltransferase
LINKKLLILSGPTASGKTSLAIDLALRLNTEIISADSRLVYKDFNIGTAKPDEKELNLVKHHMIDIISPDYKYSTALFQKDSELIINNLFSNNKIPIMAGGTGLYIRSVIDKLDFPEVEPDENFRQEKNNLALQNGNQYLHDKLHQIDPVTAKKLHLNDLFRVIRALEVYEKTGKPISAQQTKKELPYKIIYVCLGMEDRSILYQRINQRVLTMIESGLIEEVQFLVNKYGKTLSLLKTLGYKEVLDFLDHKCSLEEMIDNIQKNTRHFARRQLIWFRPDQRIIWYHLDRTSPEEVINDIINRLEIND